MRGLSAEELARLSGTTPERIARLVEIGVLDPTGQDGDFGPPDIQRVRLTEALDASGISLDLIGRAVVEGNLSFGFVDTLFPQPAALTDRTFGDAARELGMTTEALVRIYAMWGLPRPDEGDPMREDDAAFFDDISSNVPPHALNDTTLTRSARVLGESMRRVSETAQWFFRDFFERPALEAGMPRQQVMDTLAQVNAAMTPALERWVLWLLRRHAEHHLVQYIVEHIENTIEEAGMAPMRSGPPPAIAFLDLTAFTSVTEERGDEAAADYALRLAEMVLEVSASHNGRAVKLLGDGVMFYFPRPRDAVWCAFELVDATLGAGLPPARVGIAAGPVVVRDSDYFGRTVNLAARISDYARPREVLVTPEVRDAVDEENVMFDEIGPVSLQGVGGRQTLLLASAR
jgi:class 3 adenylate cyclase